MLKLFSTPSCEQCPTVTTALQSKDISFEHINAEEHPHLAAEYHVMTVPTLADEDGKTYIGTGACLAYINTVRRR